MKYRTRIILYVVHFPLRLTECSLFHKIGPEFGCAFLCCGYQMGYWWGNLSWAVYVKSANILSQQTTVNQDLLCAMMTSWNGNLFRITGPFLGDPPATAEFTSQRANNVEPWCFLWSLFEQAAEQTVRLPVSEDAVTLYHNSHFPRMRCIYYM